MQKQTMLKKKSLGQNFLHSSHYLKLIADSADIKNGEVVLEVGPGEGALTRELLARGASVVAAEKDHRLIPLLQDTFAQEIAEGRLCIHEGDILKLSPKELRLPKKYKVVANIPYYITGALLKKFLSGAHQPASMILLVQKEVAQRIAREKKESVLSLSVKVYGEACYIKTVPAGAFSPSPKVDSAILALYDISKKKFKDKKMEDRFFALVKAGFAQKRKLLKRNLKTVLNNDALAAIRGAGIAENARAEDVPLAQWLALAK